MGPSVLIADDLSPRAAEVLQERGIRVDVRPKLGGEGLREAISAYDGLAVRSATKVTGDIIAAARQLKVIGRAGIGVDTIDVKAATERGIVVMNTPSGNAVTTAEHTIALLLALARHIPSADRSTKGGAWERSRFVGVEVAGKTLGLVGCGNVGSIVADRAHGLKMRVIVHDPYLSDERAADLGVEKLPLDELLRRADFLSLHAPLTDQTRGLIDRAAFDLVKPGVRLINCARGGLLVEEDLIAALKSGRVAGVALDVFTVEPAGDNPLLAFDQVIATPHLGASTAEAQEKVAVEIAVQMADFLIAGAVTNAVNMPSVSVEEAPRLVPYMRLAELLGSFAGQLTESGIRAVSLEYEGHAAELNTRPLTAAALAGLLRPLLDQVNLVSAPAIAREREIHVAEVKHDRPSDYHTLVRLTVTTDRQSRAVAGTLIGRDHPRLVEVKGIRVEAELGRHMLYVTNEDKPGLIGRLGQTLGDAGINIATFHLGRTRPGGDAIALIEVDQPVPEAVLAAIRALPSVVQCKPLGF
jgi:D-3-phosphoglycerate dehydrogenase